MVPAALISLNLTALEWSENIAASRALNIEQLCAPRKLWISVANYPYPTVLNTRAAHSVSP